MAQTVIGFFEDHAAAQRAADQLVNNGYNRNQIDIAKPGAADADRVSGDRDGDNAITRFFKSLFGDDDDEANRYASVGRSGTSIVTVHASSEAEAERAADLLDDYGAIDVDERAARTGYKASGDFDNDAYRNRNNDREASIERIKEDLDVSKREVDKGGVRVRSRIVEKPVEENIRLREEHVRVERNPVDRAASDSELSNFREGEIEMTERKEVPVVNKEARVVEEIRLTKDVDERNETIRENVRETEVDVDKISGDKRSRLDRDDDNDLQNRTGQRNSLEDDDIRDRKDRTGSRDGDPLFGA